MSTIGNGVQAAGDFYARTCTITYAAQPTFVFGVCLLRDLGARPLRAGNRARFAVLGAPTVTTDPVDALVGLACDILVALNPQFLLAEANSPNAHAVRDFGARCPLWKNLRCAPAEAIAEVVGTRVAVIADDRQTNAFPTFAMVSGRAGVAIDALDLVNGQEGAPAQAVAEVVGARIVVITFDWRSNAFPTFAMVSDRAGVAIDALAAVDLLVYAATRVVA